MSWLPYLAGFLAIYAIRKVSEFRANARKLSNLPGLRSLFSPASLFGVFIPTYSWNPGPSWQWEWRNQIYSKHGLQTISVIPYLSGAPQFYTISMEVARQCLSVKGAFMKPAVAGAVLSLWGKNLFTENGSEWSRHRRIMNPAFTSETNALVWSEAAVLYQQMMQSEEWPKGPDVVIPAINELTNKFALLLIARCGFGQHIDWDMPPPASGMPFGTALLIVARSHILRLIAPRWIYKLPIKRLRDVETAYTSLAAFMRTLITTRRDELFAEGAGAAQHKDVFRLMIRASEGQGKLEMTDEELTGNTFLMLFAGHETTARALDAAIGFLALYEDIQEEVYEEIRQVMAADGKLNFKDRSRLIKVQSCFVEAARLFPAAHMLFRETTDTVVLKTDEEDGHGGQIILEPGSTVVIDMVGLHYNAKIFPDPEEFRPSRWYEASENNFTMFSMGSRACIGRRFALTEGVAFLANLLRDWKLHIVLSPGETRAQWRARVMTGVVTMTFGVGEVPVRVTRR
ncbi:cytochrome P450 [Mycena filopes]|nr:cytochrome P450 [Mycena filopes]